MSQTLKTTYFEDLKLGQEASLTKTVTEKDIVGFAEISGDRNPVHLDDAYARAHAEVQPGQYVMIAVTDTGAGMAPDVIARAFEPFFTTKPVGKGTGLGLYVSYGLIKEQGGDLTAANRPEGGASFTVRLPMDSHNGRG